MLRTIEVVITHADTAGMAPEAACGAIEARLVTAGIPVDPEGLWSDLRPPVRHGTLFLAHAPWDDSMVFRWIGIEH